MSWVAEGDALLVLGLDSGGPVLSLCLSAAEGQVQSWRDDITDWEQVGTTHPHVYLAGVQLAALYYQSNVTPEGFAGFDVAGGVVDPPQSKIVQIRHMARANRPKVG